MNTVILCSGGKDSGRVQWFIHIPSKPANSTMKDWDEYVDCAPNTERLHIWNLKPTLILGIAGQHNRAKAATSPVSVRALSILENRGEIEKSISYIVVRLRPRYRKLKIKFPFDLNNLDYVKIYALMLSEGSFRNEFRLHVPEDFFHTILFRSLKNLLGEQMSHFIHRGVSHNVARTSFPRVFGNLFPIPDHIPRFILLNKAFCREYVKIAFEAEGSPIFKGSKRYIRLSRCTNVTGIVGKIAMLVGEQWTFTKLKTIHPKLASRVLENPPPALLGERLILLHHFGILSKISPESIRRNKTIFRKGGFSAKWALSIYSEDLSKFAQEIGFLSEGKKLIMARMLRMQGRRRKFFALNSVILSLQRSGFFHTSDFVNKMKSLGYASPRAYLSRYEKHGLIERIKRGIYRVRPNA